VRCLGRRAWGLCASQQRCPYLGHTLGGRGKARSVSDLFSRVLILLISNKFQLNHRYCHTYEAGLARRRRATSDAEPGSAQKATST
jgi:hypothetical protein